MYPLIAKFGAREKRLILDLSGAAELRNARRSDETRLPEVIIESPADLTDLVGREIVLPEWLSITQEQIQKFAEVTNDLKWIHVDPDRAQRESPYQSTVAHGFLTLSLFSQLMREAIHIRTGVHFGINYGLERVRFPAPVRAGQQIRARFVLRSVSDIPGGRQAVYSVTLDVRDSNKPCCVADWIVRYYG
jgi:acyl dehydratase